MKCKLIIGLAVVVSTLAGSASADILLAGWDYWNGSAATQPAATNAAGITAVQLTPPAGWVRQTEGSTDLTFGTFAGARYSDPGTGLKGSVQASAGNFLDFEVTNGGSTDYILANFHMDVFRKTGTAASPEVLILAGGGITAGSLGAFDTAKEVYEDVDISLSGLGDHTLAAGESVTFRISLIDNGLGTANMQIDNVGLSAIPEPATISLIVISTISLLIFRRARR